MANDSCDPTPAASEPVKPGSRMVHCVKFGRELPGLDRPPWKATRQACLRKRFERSLEALDRAFQNGDERISPQSARSNSQKIMEEQWSNSFFGEGAKLPKAT